MRLGSDFTWFLAMYSAAGCARGVREDSDEGPKRGDFFGSAETDVSGAAPESYSAAHSARPENVNARPTISVLKVPNAKAVQPKRT
jgi:hypothetical protein